MYASSDYEFTVQGFHMAMGIGRSRWVTKKVARAGMVLAGHALNPRAGVVPGGEIHALTYHGFAGGVRDPFSVSADEFRYQLAYLAKHDLAVTLEDLDHCLRGEGLGGGRQAGVLGTIVDGLQSLYEVALPMLADADVQAIAFVTVGEIGLNAKAAPVQGLGWEARISPVQLRELSDHGVVVGSHAFTHRSLAAMSVNEAREEAIKSKALLEDFLGKPVRSFAYPYGTKADFSEATAELLRNTGYDFVFTSQHGSCTSSTSRFCIPRTKVEGGDPRWLFHGLVTGRMDGWRVVDETLWRLQSSGNRKHGA
jgi:peptidoglycan/xylan/chitin deacetylase (PgdA/CDA1 family)